MARLPLTTRDAVPSDAEALSSMWANQSTGLVTPASAEESALAIDRIAGSLAERLVVGEVEGRIVGVVYLRRGPLSPLHTDEGVHTSFLLVRPEFRHHGYARALIEVGVSWAEELDLSHVTALTTAASREANRFLVRLGLSSTATMRIAPTAVLRAKLSPAPRAGATSRAQMLAQRRSMRRRQTVR